MHSFVLLAMSGIEILTVSEMPHRFQYMPEARTLFLDSSLRLDEVYEICDELFVDSIEHALTITHRESNPSR